MVTFVTLTLVGQRCELRPAGRDDLGEDRQRDLLRRLRADVEARRRVHARAVVSTWSSSVPPL